MSELTELRERVMELTHGIAVLVSPNPKTDELLGALSLREAIRSELIQGALQKYTGTARLTLEELELILDRLASGRISSPVIELVQSKIKEAQDE